MFVLEVEIQDILACIVNREDPDQTAPSVYAVCLGLFSR